MQSEEEKIDLACLQAVHDMGGYVTLESWIYSLYLRDVVLTCDELNGSFCRLIKNKLISNFLLGYRLTSRGGAALRGEQAPKNERKKEVFPFAESNFEKAKINALRKWKMQQDGALKVQMWAGFLGVLLWLFSVACFAGGIVFACLFQGHNGWRIGAAILGVIIYILIGTVDAFACAPRCSYRMEKIITAICFPSYGLLALLMMGS